jgi:hypothetical protein
MPLAPWNNPIVISAVRSSFRQRNPTTLTTLYLLALVVGGVILEYTNFRLEDSFPLTYFVCLVAVQWFLSGAGASATATQSMRAELANGTFDFQRIATLAPRDILLGKMLGEPTLAYLMPIAALPLAVLCAVTGPISFDVLVLVHVTLATSTLMAGAMGLRGPLAVQDNPGEKKATAPLAGFFWLGSFYFLLFSGLRSAPLLSMPWLAAPAGLLTPLPIFAGLANGEPWLTFSFFGLPLPYLLVTPVSQLTLTYWMFRGMERQLVHPLNPSGSKKLSYLELIVVDILAAGIIFDMGAWSVALPIRTAVFWLVHLVASYYLICDASPSGPALRSWVWRIRPGAGLRDWFLGDRSENGLMLLTFCVIGIVNQFLFVAVPAVIEGGMTEVPAMLPMMGGAAVVGTVLILTVGSVYQRLLLQVGGSGAGVGMATATLLFLAVLIPHVVGALCRLDWVKGLSPSAHFWGWLWDDPLSAEHLVPMLAFYGAVLLWARWSLRARLRAMGVDVDRKLREMGVAPA